MKTSLLTLIFALIGASSVANGFVPAGKAFVATTSTALASSTTDAATKNPTVKAGDKIPSVVMKELVTGADGPVEVNLADLVAGKKVAIFGVPGAFTPGCSKSHLPSFMSAQEELKAKGVELTICVATNDAYVMEAWGRTSGGADAGIRFLSDDSGELTKALGLEKETPTMLRIQRFSLVADDTVVSNYFSADAEASYTWAPAVLAEL